jgi:hypothetical protein
LLKNGEISQEKISTFKKKMHVAILSKVDWSIYSLITLPLHWQMYCSVIYMYILRE